MCKKAQTLFSLAIMMYGGDFSSRVGAAYNEVINYDILGVRLLFDDKMKMGMNTYYFVKIRI